MADPVSPLLEEDVAVLDLETLFAVLACDLALCDDPVVAALARATSIVNGVARAHEWTMSGCGSFDVVS